MAKRPRESSEAVSAQPACSAAADPFLPRFTTAHALPCAPVDVPVPSTLQHRAEKDTVVLDSPYGPPARRNGAYGWGNLFQPPTSATLAHLPNVHVGISSLNGVPRTGSPAMPALLAQYRRKFRCLEHCYPYHKTGDPAAWAAWAAMVQDSNVMSSVGGGVAAVAADGPTRVRADRFLFTVKANNLLTHKKQAAMDAELEAHLDQYFVNNCGALEPYLGPVLMQFPPFFQRTPVHMQRLEQLAARLPQDTVEHEIVPACSPRGVAAGGSAGMKAEHARLPLGCARQRRRRIRIAVEFRHRSWHHPEVFDLLRRIGWTLVVAHHHDDATFATHIDTGTDFMYVRLHGALGKHVGDYGPARMRLWAEMIARYVSSSSDPREVYVFLNNSDSHVAGTTSSTVDATCLAEEIAKLLPPPPPPGARGEADDTAPMRLASDDDDEGQTSAGTCAAPGTAPCHAPLTDIEGGSSSDTADPAPPTQPTLREGQQDIASVPLKTLSSIVDVDIDSNSRSACVIDD